ncbi:hypothetical protein, partial [Elioraea rosea]
MNAPADKRPAGTEPDAGQDGSMEDILASIRRILAEDQAAPMPAAPDAAKPGEDVLDLTEQMLASEPAARSQEKGASQDMTKPEAAKPDSQAGMSAADIDALFAASKAPAAPQKPAEAMSAADIDAMFDAPAQAAPAPQPAPPAEAASPPPPPAVPAASAAAEGALLGGSTAAAAAASFAALRAAARG